MLGDRRAIGEEERLEDLLDEMRRTHQEHYLPFGPIGDPVRVLIDHRDECQLHRKPQRLGDDPHEEVRLEAHLPRHGVLPEGGVEAEVSSKCFHPPTAEYFRMPRYQTKRASI